MNSIHPQPATANLLIRPALLSDIPVIQHVANETWPAAYGNILSTLQLEYMLQLFYSTPALTQQMQDNQHFFLALYQLKPVGFASFTSYEPGIFKLQKLYVLPGTQKTGAGKQLLRHVENEVKNMHGTTLILNVNRHNNARTFYEKQGFTIVQQVDVPIGQGYFMNDFVMEKKLL